MSFATLLRKPSTRKGLMYGLLGLGLGASSLDLRPSRSSAASSSPLLTTHETSQDDDMSYYTAPSSESSMKIFTGNANRHLAHEVALHLGTQVGRMTVKAFADGETSVKCHDNVRGQKVYLIQPTCAPVDSNIVELLLMITTLRRASAKQIVAIIPYYGYGRKTEMIAGKNHGIASADIAIMLEVAGVDRVVAIDLHRAQIQGFFSPHIPVDNLDGSMIAIPYLQTKFLRNPVIVSPDANGTARAKSFADRMTKVADTPVDFAMVVHTKFDEPEEASSSSSSEPERLRTQYQLVGDVNNRDVVIVDDMIDSGNRMIQTSKLLKEHGAHRVFAFATHGLFTGDAIEHLEASEIIEVIVSNTIPMTIGPSSSKIQQLSVGALIAHAIKRIHKVSSVSVSR